MRYVCDQTPYPLIIAIKLYLLSVDRLQSSWEVNKKNQPAHETETFTRKKKWFKTIPLNMKIYLFFDLKI